MEFKLDAIGDVGVVEIIGRAMDESARLPELGRQLKELVDRRGHRRIILDLANVQFLASSALGMLVSLQQKIAYHKGRLVICNLRKNLHQVFKFAKLDGAFTICDTGDDALASFDAPPTGG